MDYVGKIFYFFDGEDCRSTVAGPPSNERELEETIESADDGSSDSYHSMRVVEDCDDDEDAERVFLDTANEREHNENIIYKDITDRDDTDDKDNTDRDITDQDGTNETNIENVNVENVSDNETLIDSVSPDTESLVSSDNPHSEDGPVREDLCEDESILMSALDDFPVDHLQDHHQPATSTMEDQIAFNEGDLEENAMCEEDAISTAGSCTATAGSSTKTIDSEDSTEEYSRMHPPVDQLRLMDRQRQDAMREQLNMAWQASLDYILNRNAVAMTKVMDLLSYSRWEAARLRTEVDVLKSKLHDQVCSHHQLLNLLKVREGEMFNMSNDIRELGAECAHLMDEVSNLKKTKDEDNQMVECLKNEKADLQVHVQELREQMEVKQMEHESVVSQLTHEKSELQDALLKRQARPE